MELGLATWPVISRSGMQAICPLWDRGQGSALVCGVVHESRLHSMPLQNRVDPYGALHATEARGAWMGNRGVLHDASKQVVAAWRLRRWITCVLSFKDRRREVFAPNRYSELFFLDEATRSRPGIGPAPSAGGSATRSSAARGTSVRARAGRGAPVSGAEAIDRVLHAERLEAGGVKRAYVAVLSSLPDGAMVDHDGHSAPRLEREALALELFRVRSRRRCRARDGGRRADPALDRARDPSGLRAAGARERRPDLSGEVQGLTAASSTDRRTRAP